jgi:hypothetical protein
MEGTRMMLYNNVWTKAKVNPDRLQIEVMNLRTTVTLQRWTFFSMAALDKWLTANGYHIA